MCLLDYRFNICSVAAQVSLFNIQQFQVSFLSVICVHACIAHHTCAFKLPASYIISTSPFDVQHYVMHVHVMEMAIPNTMYAINN